MSIHQLEGTTIGREGKEESLGDWDDRDDDFDEASPTGDDDFLDAEDYDEEFDDTDEIEFSNFDDGLEDDIEDDIEDYDEE